MTIKQQGGIFGRNPTFNDVTIDGSLNASSISLTSFDASDQITAVGPSKAAAVFDRTTTVGDIIDLQYDGSSIGSIGTNFGFVLIGNEDTYLSFRDSQADIVPAKATGSSKNGVTSLGVDSSRFKDLYLSSGVDVKSAGEAYLQMYSNVGGGIEYRGVIKPTSNGLTFQTRNGAYGSLIDQWYINTSGNLKAANAGAGIDFSATSGTGTSELFDDYEEGTWTPAYDDLTATGTFTHDTQDGVYTKIGDTVIATFEVRTSSVSGAPATNLYITGLPFSKATGVRAGGFISERNNYSGDMPTNFWVSGGSNYMLLIKNDGTANSHNILGTDLATGSSSNQIAGTIIYKAS